MNFYIKKIILWLWNGNKREIEFLPNKVNIITGNSNTGKTAILYIIDYCLFASKSKISESIINENTEWYGISFVINSKEYTIARKSMVQNKVSEEYYFSSTGEIPLTPTNNNDANAIKTILEVSFGINSNVRIPYGSKVIKTGTKISIRYFLVFNTISQDIITNSETFFDKQNEQRYRDALVRIFDLATGIDSVENKLKKERKDEIEQEITILEKKRMIYNSKKNEFHSELNAIVKQAKEYGIINPEMNVENSIESLKSAISGTVDNIETEISKNKYDELQRERNILERKIKNLNRFKNEYENYKKNIEETHDSLKPIEYLYSQKNELIRTSKFEDIIRNLIIDLKRIKKYVSSSSPIDLQIFDVLENYKRVIESIDHELESLPGVNRNFNNEKEKLIFLGELKAKLKLYSTNLAEYAENTISELDQLYKQKDLIEIVDTKAKRELTIKLLEEIIQDFIKEVGSALENYTEYHPIYNYNLAKLQLRKPKTSHIENVGSSSNHMFLHLFLFLGLHEIIQENNSPFVAPFLIVDQPSRPYWGDDNKRKTQLEHSDESKIITAFKLLNHYIERKLESGKTFQMIVFEHIPKTLLDEKGMDYVYFVEEFINGNALIPKYMLSITKGDKLYLPFPNTKPSDPES